MCLREPYNGNRDQSHRLMRFVSILSMNSSVTTVYVILVWAIRMSDFVCGLWVLFLRRPDGLWGPPSLLFSGYGRHHDVKLTSHLSDRSVTVGGVSSYLYTKWISTGIAVYVCEIHNITFLPSNTVSEAITLNTRTWVVLGSHLGWNICCSRWDISCYSSVPPRKVAGGGQHLK
jgi:hypothetical protein